MSMCPKTDAMENGLKSIVDELIGAVWVESGKAIPSFNIWEADKAIEVIPIDRETENYQIDMRVGKKQLRFKWKSGEMILKGCGVYFYDWGDCNMDELAIAGGLMLMYYGQAMAEETSEAI